MITVMSCDAVNTRSICYKCKALTCHGCVNYQNNANPVEAYDMNWVLPSDKQKKSDSGVLKELKKAQRELERMAGKR